MTTTDTDALKERIARALHGFEWDCAHDGSDGEWALSEAKPHYLSFAAAVLPIVAAEVRKAKAEALREAADDQALRLSGHSGISITRLRGRATEYETGDSDEHR